MACKETKESNKLWPIYTHIHTQHFAAASLAISTTHCALHHNTTIYNNLPISPFLSPSPSNHNNGGPEHIRFLQAKRAATEQPRQSKSAVEQFAFVLLPLLQPQILHFSGVRRPPKRAQARASRHSEKPHYRRRRLAPPRPPTRRRRFRARIAVALRVLAPAAARRRRRRSSGSFCSFSRWSIG